MLPAGIIALGLVQGSLAALNALGLVLLWRTTRVINLAQAAMGLVGGVLVGLLVTAGGWSFWWALPVGLSTGALLGLGAERLVLSRLQDAPRAVLLVATVGIAHVFGALQAALPFAFDGPLPTYSIDLGFTIELFPVRLLGPHLLALASVPIALFVTHRFLHRSRVGLAACALGQDAERARALGVPAASVRAIAWMFAGFLASLSGTLSIPVLGFNLGGGLAPTVLLFALTPAVLAGLRSLPGAVGGALALGVAYQACLWWTDRAGVADLLLAGSVVVAVALQRRRLGRAETAARTSSWDAATTPRPLPWSVSSSVRVRSAAALGAAALLTLAVIPPIFLSPGDDVLYATSSAFALGALAVALAWMFAGEVVLGHWGLAGLGAAVAAFTPGHWVVRCAVATVAMAVAGAILANASRRRSTLSFAVLGLAAAAAAPVAVLLVGQDTVPADPGVVGAIGGALVVVSVVATIKLRSSMLGSRLVCARDDPERAIWLGARPAPARTLALAMSGGLAGLAGALYLAATPAGIAPGAFDAQVSLSLLAMGVVGGLGSPLGAVLGAAALQSARLFLPGSWALLATGAGILVVVLFAPAGLSGALVWFRDASVRALGVGAAVRKAIAAPKRGAGRSAGFAVMADGDGSRIAGSDTREAGSTQTVRLAATAALAAAGPTLAAILGGARAWERWIALPDWAPVWFTVGMATLTAVLAFIGWRIPLAREMDARPKTNTALNGATAKQGALPAATGAAATIFLLGVVVAMTGDEVLGALSLPVVAAIGGWIIGRAARLAGRASVPGVRMAAGGIVIAMSLVGILPAGHLLLVSSGSGIPRAGLWASVYGLLALVWLVRADRALPGDHRRARVRTVTPDMQQPTKRQANAALVSDRVTVHFGPRTILDDATLVVASGEMMALVGGNGAGKSTLLRVVAGFVPPESGRIVVAGEDFTTLLPEERASAGLAFVSGARPVFPDLSVIENLRVAAFRSHTSLRSFNAATDTVLNLVPALADRRESRVGVLSGGEQRLLAVAQTLYRKPIVLLADELTLGLDVEAREAVLDVLRLLAREGVAVVAVDHDLPALLSRADRASLLAGGAITEHARPTSVLDRRADLLPADFLAGVAR